MVVEVVRNTLKMYINIYIERELLSKKNYKTKYDIFISYARKDFEEVNRFVGMHSAESGFSESDKEK